MSMTLRYILWEVINGIFRPSSDNSCNSKLFFHNNNTDMATLHFLHILHLNKQANTNNLLVQFRLRSRKQAEVCVGANHLPLS